MKKRKKNKVKVKRIVGFFIIILVICLLIIWYKDKRITNIYVTGNNLVSEQTIIELAEIQDYPFLYKVSASKIKKRLLTSPFIEKVEVKKGIFGKIYINVFEYRVLCMNGVDNQYILSDGKSILYDDIVVGVPILTNEVKNDVYNKFISALKKVDDSIMYKISQITYDANDLDDERFLLYMTDHNYVYVTLDKIENINSYNEIVPTLEGKKGILYLDSGNHFLIKK